MICLFECHLLHPANTWKLSFSLPLSEGVYKGRVRTWEQWAAFFSPCLCKCEWQGSAQKHVGRVDLFITLGKAISLELMSSLMTAAKPHWPGETEGTHSKLKPQRAVYTWTWWHNQPHRCCGAFVMEEGGGNVNLPPHLLAAYKNYINQFSPRLTATLSLLLSSWFTRWTLSAV